MSLIQTGQWNGGVIHQGATFCLPIRVKPDGVNPWNYTQDVTLVRAKFRREHDDVNAIFEVDSSVQVGSGGSYIDTSDGANGWMTISISAADTAAQEAEQDSYLYFDVEMVVPQGTLWSAEAQTRLGVAGTTGADVVIKPLQGRMKFEPNVTY